MALQRVMIECPVTGKPVSTNILTSESSLESSTYDNRTLNNCPACGQDHTWSKEIAFLDKRKLFLYYLLILDIPLVTPLVVLARLRLLVTI